MSKKILTQPVFAGIEMSRFFIKFI